MSKVTPLYERHKELGAKVIEFGGFMMPVQYTSIIDEHLAVRNRAGIFDVSHMGEIEVTGRDALKFLERMITRKLEDLKQGRVAYGMLCNDEGGILDDLTVYRRGNSYYLVVNASTTDSDYEWLTWHRDEWGMKAKIDNVSDATGKIDLQGPMAVKVAEKLGYPKAGGLKHFHFLEVPEERMIISRSGYTGEDGFEFYLPAEDTVAMWNRMLDAGRDMGLLPCGLGARDTLRLEACLVLNGSDIGPQYDPFRAGLGWAVDLTKSELVGMDALKCAAGIIEKDDGVRVLTPFVLEGRSSVHHGAAIYSGGVEIGAVTSGSYCPSLEKAAGMGYIARRSSRPGNPIEVEARKRRLAGVTAVRPLYKK
jgi:aminomethyltransferase